MMPLPLAAPAGPPAAPAAPAAPGDARTPLGDRHAAAGEGDFTGILALLAGLLSSPPSPPVVDVPAGGPDKAADTPPAGAAPDAPPPSALEALVAALAQQASGISPAPSAPSAPTTDPVAAADAAPPEPPAAAERSPAS